MIRPVWGLTAAFCGFIAIAAVAGSPVHAADRDELALAREYWRLHAILGGYAAQKEDQLETASRNLIKICSDTPAAQLPRSMLQTCEDFDAWKPVHERTVIRKALEEAQSRELNARIEAEKTRPYYMPPPNDPGGVALSATAQDDARRVSIGEISALRPDAALVQTYQWATAALWRSAIFADRLPMLDVACSKRDRRDRLNVAKLVEQHGALAITLYEPDEPETVIVLSD